MSETVKIVMPEEAPEQERVADRKLANRAADAIEAMCDWEDLEEGYEFWASVHDRLRQLVERGF